MNQELIISMATSVILATVKRPEKKAKRLRRLVGL